MAKESARSDLEKIIRQKLIEIESKQVDSPNIDNLKKLINLQLTETGIHSKVLHLLSQQKNTDGKKRNSNQKELKKEELHSLIKDGGVLDEIFKNFDINESKVKSSPVKNSKNLQSSETLTSKERLKQGQKQDSSYYLRLNLIKGKAFVEYLLEPAILSGQPSPHLLLYVYFCGQRFHSQPTPAVCEPEFLFDIKLLLQKNDKANLALDPSNFLSMNDPIHIILTKVDADQNQFLVSSYFLEWRDLLSKPGSKMSMSIELPGIGVENKVPAGMLELYIELQPPLISPLHGNLVSAQLALEHSRKTERNRLFLAYAKLWWREYIEMRPEHTERLVKIFAQDENAVVRPVFSYVYPLSTNRLLETPREAAWFVSLFRQNLSIYTNIDRTKYEQWKNLSTYLCIKEGDYEDHSVLLCSLLLGFGLDAYVCLGTLKKEQPCSWVMTIGREKQVTFWNSLTSTRYNHFPVIRDDKIDEATYPYKTIGCVFNNNRFFANCQPTDAVHLCSFNLEDSEKWKAMSPDAMELISTYVPTIPMIVPSSLNSLQVSNDLEIQLKHFATELRMEKKLSCFWDDKLCHLLSSALANYEYQGKIGIENEDEDFHDAIYRIVPEGHTFKALPVHFLHRNSKKIFQEILQSPLGQEIICCQGDMVRLAVRARIYTYVEDVMSVWVNLFVQSTVSVTFEVPEGKINIERLENVVVDFQVLVEVSIFV